VFWNVNEETQIIDFAVKVRTDGWAGIGFGNGNMIGSDMAIGWVDEATGEPKFSDR
tara:strand:+ start:250 stop:417 length:168 start_codon:yes stop_codon:yes gene_type:complete